MNTDFIIIFNQDADLHAVKHIYLHCGINSKILMNFNEGFEQGRTTSSVCTAVQGNNKDSKYRLWESDIIYLCFFA
jgi:hypothetical protein